MITRFNKIGLIAALLVSALSTPSNIALAQSSSSIWTGDKRPRAAQVEETPWITEEVDSPSDLDEILMEDEEVEELLRTTATNLLPWENTPYYCGSAGTRQWDYTTFQSVGTPNERDGGYFKFTSTSGVVTTGKFVFAKPIPISGGTSWEYTHPLSPTGQCKATAVTERTYWKPQGSQTCEYLESKVVFNTCEGILKATTCKVTVKLGCEDIEP